MKTSIALIGFMGVGKTAVGRVLAEKLGKEFIELDSEIEKKAKKSIPEIFRHEGEIGFRQIEIEVIREIAGQRNVVIACGGGIVLNKINIDRLRKECIIVYLTASPAAILKRTSDDKNERPLLSVADRAGQIKELLRFRRPFYERAADIKINTSGLNVLSVADKIIEKLKEDESFFK
jgi:shikimate kinase